MKAAQAGFENTDITQGKTLRCSQCGWPGIGIRPAGVRVIKRDGKDVLIGLLSYYRVSSTLCSICQEMEYAVASRPWFVKAHAEYLDQIHVKKRLLGGI
ncbi:MAG TPA: hypothetical protein VNM68_11355 [Candidatus Polarisedimenticolia bacterium]|nr:hypothetical protein [Candidatus Polarisedimenticolia bacterium]